jgi:hypothetical protein
MAQKELCAAERLDPVYAKIRSYFELSGLTGKPFITGR